MVHTILLRPSYYWLIFGPRLLYTDANLPHIVFASCHMLSTILSTLGKASSEEQSVLYCLKLIEHCLEKQTTLLSLLRDGNSAVLITPMDKLLLSINPNSAEADYPYKIAR